MARALDGILVVSLEQAVAAPLASARLADSGARVIKIERQGGDFARAYDRVAKGQSAYFVWLNRGKESIVLDIKDGDDKALLHRMLGRADVLIQNLAPGAAARAGFDSGELRRRHPRLVTCDISGYGEDGPYAEMKAYDLLVQAETGLASVTGSPAAPARVGVSVCDIAAGMNAAAGILEALISRQRTGEGSQLKVSLFDSLADWMTVPLLYYDYGGRTTKRTGLHHPVLAPYGAYAAKGGELVVISIQSEREWAVFCAEVLGRPELSAREEFRDNPARVANREALDREIRAIFGDLDREALKDRLKRAKIAFGAVNSVADLSRHPALRRAKVDTPAGALDLVAPPLRMAGNEPGLRPVPELGQHTEAIRAEFGAPRANKRKGHAA